MTRGWGLTDNKKDVVDIGSIRQAAVERINALCDNLLQKGPAAAAFARAARPANDEGGFFGSLALEALFWGPLMGAMFDGLGEGGSVAADAVEKAGWGIAGVEGACMLADGRRPRFIGGAYPEGRRHIRFNDLNRMKKRFNLASTRSDDDGEAEITALAGLMELVRALERRGVTAIAVEENETVHETLKKAHAGLFSKGAIKTYSAGMRVAV
jgi:hypothetical protein